MTDELWCQGCGFANTSAGLCEVCGWDDDAGAFDRDFIDERDSWRYERAEEIW